MITTKPADCLSNFSFPVGGYTTARILSYIYTSFDQHVYTCIHLLRDFLTHNCIYSVYIYIYIIEIYGTKERKTSPFNDVASHCDLCACI